MTPTREELEEEVAQLRELAFGTEICFTPDWGLTATETLVVRLALHRPIATRAAYEMARRAEDWDFEGDDGSLTVLRYKARRKLAARGITMRTQWGRGWYFDASDKAKLRAAIFNAPPPVDVPLPPTLREQILAFVAERPKGVREYDVTQAFPDYNGAGATLFQLEKAAKVRKAKVRGSTYYYPLWEATK